MTMKLKRQTLNHIPTVKISGSVSGKDAMVLSDELRAVCESDSSRVVVDLSETVNMDSSAMGVIIYWWKNLKQQSRRLVLFNPRCAVLEMLETTNLDKLISVIDSAEKLSTG
jgi:anti-anti-sigma factor